ncbi:hypothetical protein H5410_053448 [Solanum commersonii]|uniref:No apical meristem-associated C-terminal domain-containing protein n=1 Tax=Solanum commersonii TaxID=4109 RepID=A0A9J5X5X6_SOLCO|nr:hypothetical protein H5410_053448 [Solanum commersonii]
MKISSNDISQDLITGICQSYDQFWVRIEQSYNNLKEESWIYRNKKSLQCRIGLIEKAIRKLSGCIRQIENLHPSGASDIDIINQAKMLLMQEPTYKKSFKFDHVWNLMKDFEKFKDIDIGKKKIRGQGSTLQSSESEATSPTSPIVSSPNLSSFSLNLNENFSGHYTSSEQPIGVKKSKLKRSKDESISSAMKLFETENNRLGEMLSESATSKQQDDERLDRYIKTKEFKDETKILMKNLETISDPNIRDYLQREPQRILEKRNRQLQSQSQPQSQPQSQQFLESYPIFFSRIVLNLETTYWISKSLL